VRKERNERAEIINSNERRIKREAKRSVQRNDK
jgi:hypothetical protein